MSKTFILSCYGVAIAEEIHPSSISNLINFDDNNIGIVEVRREFDDDDFMKAHLSPLGSGLFSLRRLCGLLSFLSDDAPARFLRGDLERLLWRKLFLLFGERSRPP